MGEFEKCIKELYPKDGERIANKYPDTSYEELYWSEFDVWQFQQSKIEQLEKKISTFKERIENAEKFINQIPCQSTWEAESRQDAMKALRNGKKFKEPKKLPHTHIFISNTCECGWTIDQEKAFRGES